MCARLKITPHPRQIALQTRDSSSQLPVQGATDDLITLGLRTLDYWEDSLNPEFLEPAMAEVMDDLMAVLWSHLKPHPYPFGQKVSKAAFPGSDGRAPNGHTLLRGMSCGQRLLVGGSIGSRAHAFCLEIGRAASRQQVLHGSLPVPLMALLYAGGSQGPCKPPSAHGLFTDANPQLDTRGPSRCSWKHRCCTTTIVCNLRAIPFSNASWTSSEDWVKF